jgi:cytochrome P450
MHSVSMTAYLATQGDLERLLLQWRQQYGPFFEFQVPGSPPVMVVSDPDAIREVRHATIFGTKRTLRWNRCYTFKLMR